MSPLFLLLASVAVGISVMLAVRFQLVLRPLPSIVTASVSRLTRSLQSLLRTVGTAVPTRLLWVGVIGTLAITTATSLRTAAFNNTVELPIEVLPPDGASPHIEPVTLSISNASGIDSMYIQGHHLDYHKSEYADQNGYDTKASFRVNGGPWVAISNATSVCRFPESQYGCIGGPYNTLRLRVDATRSGAWRDGSNLVEFRFNGTEGISSGYRILEIDVLAGSMSRMGNTTFVEANPDSWGPATSNPADLAEGRDLFQQRNLLTEGPDGLDIVASCADCHARDGRDLWYYNFSNRSIEARSRFHGLSQSDAEKISSWIRTLHTGPDAEYFELPAGMTVGDLGRPWNPPYQPGPGTDDRPVEQWAAGAGLDWVLDTDAETKEYLFPDGLNGPSAESIASTESTLNVREIPVAVPFPDISEWWPDYHPLDAYGDPFLDMDVYQGYQDILALNDPTVRDREVQDAISGDRRFSGILSYFDDFHQDGINVTPQGRFGETWDMEAQVKHSFQLWQLMKTWEAMHRYDLEDIAPDVLPGRTDEIRDDRDTVPGGEKYQWFHQNQIAWWAAPHMNSRPYFPGTSPYQTQAQNQFFSHTWYQLQLTLNAGSRWPNGNKPMDWKYHFDLLSETSMAYDVPAGWRYTLSFIKQQQMYDTGKPIGRSSWFVRHTHPRWLFREGKGRRAMWQAMGSDHLEVLELVTRSFVETSMHYADSTPADDPYGAQAWPRSSDPQVEEVEPFGYTPTFNEGFHHSRYKANGFYLMAGELFGRGADPAVVDELARWGDAMWPNGDWSQWFATDGQAEVSLNQGWNLISADVAPDTPNMESIFADIEGDVVIVKNELGESYVPGYEINTIGEWSNAQAYKVFVNAPRTLLISGTEMNASSDISLSAGWNYVGYWPDTAMPAEEAFASLGSDLVIAKDVAGNAYVPAENVNTLHDGTGEVRPGQGYQVYVASDAVLSYPDIATSGGTPRASSETGSSTVGPASGVAASSTVIVHGESLDDGTRVLALTDEGDMVGAGTVTNGRALVRVWADNPQTAVVDGASPNQSLQFAILSDASEEPLPLDHVRDIISGRPAAKTIQYADNQILVARVDAEPVEVDLEQNYPNPARTTTTIEYTVPSAGTIQLQVYDLLGRKVATLVDEEKGPGRHSVSVDASRFSSGVYFYRLRAGGTIESRKMVVVK